MSYTLPISLQIYPITGKPYFKLFNIILIHVTEQFKCCVYFTIITNFSARLEAIASLFE